MSSRNAASHEYCQGYVDKNGIWNNGFYCRRWGGQDVTYCCGDGKERFCCPETPQSITPTNSSPTPAADRFNHIPIIIGICVSLLIVVVFVVAALCCLCCSCCPAKKRQRIRMRKQSSSMALSGTIPICTEAEVTSSVIAAEAIQLPVRDFSHCQSGRCGVGGGSMCGASPSPTRDIRSGYVAGRAWSPNASSQMDDFDTLFITSLYHHNDTHDLSWHPELQNLCNCGLRPNSNPQPKIRETNLRLISSGPSSAFKQSDGSPSAFCFDALNSKRSRMTDDGGSTPPYSKHPSLELQKPRLSPFRLGGIVLSSQSQLQQQKPKEPFRLAAGLISDADRHKRDSGVLVEEQDASDNSSSPFGQSLTGDDQMTTDG